MASSQNLSISLKEQQYLGTRECEIGSAAAAHRSREGSIWMQPKGQEETARRAQARRVREAQGRQDSRVGTGQRAPPQPSGAPVGRHVWLGLAIRA
jgi:hypothetical protein